MSTLDRPGSGALSAFTYGREARSVYRETDLASLRVDGAAALAGRVMHRFCELDRERRALARGDASTNQMLVEIELGFLLTVGSIQRQLYGDNRFR